ncbi:alpha/beta hydrolase [Marinobacter sp. CA1]|uniref:alpha/beta hydrolase n=1 Tax=Marinobacter sp. CA1 TaxID=2817656 RepID=UPI001D05DAB8|nr:alpha/beta hydrolase [Marinobacter sp. CA1]UDL06186.1 alpha/beta hydrolase [Marinobacter sp. CA1]
MLTAPAPDSSLLRWLGGINQPGSGPLQITPSLMRKSLARMTETFVTDLPAIARVWDDQLAGPHRAISLRHYDPAPEAATPVALFIHGGGHMCGSVQIYDGICRKLAAASGHLVVSVDYRLAPEHPYPAALEDCQAVIRQLWQHLDQHQIRYRPSLSLVGDSGGGALCATLAAQSQQDQSLPVRQQALIYPSLDYTLSSPSIDELANGYLLEKTRIQWYFDHYLQRGECRTTVSPLFMPVTPAHPPTGLITAGFCPLRDEGRHYLDRLSSIGIATQHHSEDTMIHAYLNLENLVPQACERTYRWLSQFLNRD